MNEYPAFTLELDHVSKQFSSKAVVNDVSLQIKEGEVFGLLGPNGAGKTTTIRMIVGLIRPTSGQIRLLGNDIRKSFTRAIQGVGASKLRSLLFRCVSFRLCTILHAENARRCSQPLR